MEDGRWLKRKVDIYLEEWKNKTNKKPLIIRGARQIGKTKAVEKFAEKNYKNLLSSNKKLVNRHK